MFKSGTEKWTFVGDAYSVLADAYIYRDGSRAYALYDKDIVRGLVILRIELRKRNQRSHAYVIYADETPVGMAMYYDIDHYQAYDFSQLFIDCRYQGKGYGEIAAKKILEMMKADGKHDKVYICYIEGNEAARCLYEKLGFKPTGEVDEDEVIMLKNLNE